MRQLEERLRAISGHGYKAYKQLAGRYRFDRFQLSIDHVQGDPFALPSRITVHIPQQEHELPPPLWMSRCRQTALEDCLGKSIATAISHYCKGRRGSGNSGQFRIATSGQQILRRNAVLIGEQNIEVRLLIGLPADGRSVLSHEAAIMLLTELPAVITHGVLTLKNNLPHVVNQVEQSEDQDFLRHWLPDAGAVAFIANGATLPRFSGVDDRPLKTGVPFQAAENLQRTVSLPNQGTISGMIIPRGVTLIVGGGFHGKSTLLQALERGVYNHRPGDGRERVVTAPNAVKIRAEDHRSICNADISPFLGNLPQQRSTTEFSTDNASGSTSQAANIVEALACGCDLLLIDEDTSATNFMIRDQRMQQLVRSDQEPITPLLHRIRELYEHRGVSSVIVTGGSGDYLSVADTVIQMHNYQPIDVSAKARVLAGDRPRPEHPLRPWSTTIKPMETELFNASAPPKKIRIDVHETGLMTFGRQKIDLSCVEQLVDRGQTEAIGYLLLYCAKTYPDHPQGLIAALQNALDDTEQNGLDILYPWACGHLALPRLYELAAAAHRLRLPA
ncbi:MAG: ATPase [Desulfuromonas sp.]|nr:MAG: ATPase [Desulfuromonas sp.]